MLYRCTGTSFRSTHSLNSGFIRTITQATRAHGSRTSSDCSSGASLPTWKSIEKTSRNWYSFYLPQTDYDWNLFARIFYIKEYNLFEYQARTLLDDEVKLAKWSNDEDYMLYSIITRDKNAKWNEIAKNLFLSSSKAYVRSSKQCRERWLNHLDPSKSKTGWSLE